LPENSNEQNNSPEMGHEENNLNDIGSNEREDNELIEDNQSFLKRYFK